MEKNEYLDMFIEESKEHLQAMNSHLLELEENPENESIVNEVFRSAHTLKGMSATMGYEDLASLTHQMENVLDQIRNGVVKASSELLDVVFESVDHLEAMVEDIASGGEGKRNVKEVVSKLARIESGAPLEEVAATLHEVDAETVQSSGIPAFDPFEVTVLTQSQEQGFYAYQVAISLREDCILKAARVYMVFEVLEKMGEVIKSIPTVDQLEEENFDLNFSVTLVSKESANDVQGKVLKVSEVDTVEVSDIDIKRLNSPEKEQAEKVKKDSNEIDNEKPATTQVQREENQSNGKSNSNKTIRVNIERLDRLMNLFEELVIDRGRLEQISHDLNNNDLTDTVEHMSRISGDLQNIILNMRMVPVEQVFNRFPRMVRGLAKELNKKINLEITGADTELDRTFIDEIGDPLVHLLRNSLDHGVETPDVRRNAGKSEQATISLKAYHSGNHVFIEVADDGAGINAEKVLEKAINSGVVSAEVGKTLTDQEVYELLFASGLSTADQISDISGRGVGLDVVKSKIESLGGSVSVESTRGTGTLFTIQLPLTLSIISVMLVEIQDEIYAIPLSSIIETAIIKEEEIMHAHNQRVIDFRGSVVPLIDMTELFEVPVTKEQNEYYSIVVVRKGDKMAALQVNSFIGQQEIVLKTLGKYLTSAFAISGATILGNGQVALIVDCNSIIL
ncbi:chemotaxis protein CheA [Evansella cellulosilytica]|uniref:Chemotaxis protein CheA n=1 Tax=Evansella cellulosilytica (strain ATCC 21833 / DSM 2522 / FERM P-1141 / JCM 9156 / N-4) TaxID=649639 RepID=E6TSU4_EVAC2|nr:chemotaxis protein CheA [Evansella cellulosilytica]ADU30736.1 CheA signal transduction histidine kinase [Evansella cellulosilytica DSM 2522]